MKIQPFKAEQFINSISGNKNIYGALVYGPESGIVSINSTKIASLIVPNSSDPFLISNLDSKKIEEDGAVIHDEFVSIPMLGGRKLIRIDGASNKITNFLKPIFGNDKKATEFSKPVGDNFILITADNLDASSSLRKFADNNPYFASIACYEDNEPQIRNIIAEKLRSYGLKAENGVVDLIINKFGKNRLIIINELEKLALYLKDKNDVTCDDVQNIIADISQISTNEFVNSFLNLDIVKSNMFLEKLLDEKVNEVSIIRYLTNYFIKLYTIKNNILCGSNYESEIKSQRIFFKQEPIFKKHYSIWDIKMISIILKKLQELEVKCKNNAFNSKTLLLSFNNYSYLKFKNKVRK